MVEKMTEQKLYKIPTNEILESRRKFYALKRNPCETIEKWMYRVCGHMDVCDFPQSIEYIFTDKFLCELTVSERELIRKSDTNWSLICEYVSI